MANQFKRVLTVLKDLVHDVDGADEGATLEYAALNRVHRVNFAADALAADTWTRTIMVADKDMDITAVKIVPDATLTAHDTNYATMSFATGTIGATASRDSFTTKITGGSGNWAVATAEAFTVATSTDSLTSGQILTVSKAVAAAGVVIPAHHIEVHYKYTNAA